MYVFFFQFFFKKIEKTLSAGLSIDAQLLRVLDYLEVEVGISSADICKVVREFVREQKK